MQPAESAGKFENPIHDWFKFLIWFVGKSTRFCSMAGRRCSFNIFNQSSSSHANKDYLREPNTKILTNSPSRDYQLNPVYPPWSRQRNSTVLVKTISSSLRVMSPSESLANQGPSLPMEHLWQTEAFLDLDRPLNRENVGKLINSFTWE